MTQDNTRCPQCESVVEPSDTICMNCYFELHQNAAPVPTRQPTRQQAPARPEPMHPDTRPDIPPGGGGGPGGGSTPPLPDDWMPNEPEAAPAQVPQAHVTNVSALSARPDQPAGREDTSMRFRPKLRPPMAVITVFDDDGEDGETHRVRTREVTFGRAEGDIIIPHDRMMSGTHAKLICRNVDGSHRWFLLDLDSTNGTFVRVKSSKLEHNSMAIIGAFRYRFNAAPQGADVTGEEHDDAPQATMGWKKVSPEDLMAMSPSLIRITQNGEGNEYKLPGSDQIVGSDAKAGVHIDDDQMLGPSHIRIFQDEYQRWKIEDLGSTNGTWISVKEKRLDMTGHIQLGEQRFKIRFP